MNFNRRQFIRALAPAALFVPSGYAWQLRHDQEQKPPKPDNSQGVPKPPIGWPGDDGEPPFPRPDLKGNQQKIHDDVERLHFLVDELREQVKKTDSSNVLSLGIVQKASQIEKLARQIKDLAHG